MNDINTVTISRGEYELLIRGKSKLEVIERTVRDESSDIYGLSHDCRVVIEAVLGIHNKEKAD